MIFLGVGVATGSGSGFGFSPKTKGASIFENLIFGVFRVVTNLKGDFGGATFDLWGDLLRIDLDEARAGDSLICWRGIFSFLAADGFWRSNLAADGLGNFDPRDFGTLEVSK